MMSGFSAVTVVFLVYILHTSYGQFSDDVINKGTTCESKYDIEDCLVSAYCLVKFLLDCECVPNAVGSLLTLPLPGKILCL